MQVKLYNTSAKQVGELELNDSVFGFEYNEALIHQVIVATQANARQGTKSALTRAEVRGGGIKPWRQKGTGRARQGSIRSPQWTKGGVVFAPKPRDFSKKVNKQMRTGAFLSAISYKVSHDELIALDKLTLEQPKTKLLMNVLNNLKANGKTLIIVADHEQDILRAGNNIDFLTITTSQLVNVYEVVRNKTVIATADALKRIQEAYAI